MSFSITRLVKGLRVFTSGTTTPANVDIIPAGTANTTTTLTSSQTADRTVTLPDITGTVLLEAGTQTVTGKTIDSDLNTITNIENADIKAGAAIDATKIADGSVTNTEFQYLDATSSIQTQLNGKQSTGNYITDLTGDVTATGPGSAAATVVSVGGSLAADINSAELAANAATELNTASTIVKRDASGNFAAGMITADLTGDVTGNADTATTAGNVTGTVAIANGGTGQTTKAPAFDALAPTTTKADIIVHNGTNNIRVPVGTDGQLLTADSTQASGVKWTNNAAVLVSASNSVSTQTLPNSSYTKVSFDNTYIDTSTAFSSGSFTAPSNGYYRFSGYINISPSTSTYTGSVYLLLNGATTIRFCNTDKSGTASVYFNITFDFMVQLSTSDIIEVYAYQNSGASLTIRGDDAASGLTSLIVQKVG